MHFFASPSGINLVFTKVEGFNIGVIFFGNFIDAASAA